MEEPLQPPSKQPKRFFDIAPPKDFVPSTTSRPLIVGHQPQQADPMVTAAVPERPNPEPVVTEPEPQPEAVTEPVTPVETVTSPETSAAMMQQEYDEVEHELPVGAPVPELKATNNPDTVVLNDQPVTQLPDASVAGQVSQPVVVHHQKPHHRLNKELLVVFLAIILLVVVADVLLDANIWKPTHNFPHTHFFSHGDASTPY